jgi:hypothetical protein
MLAEELRYLPLALEQAGAFIESELSGSIEAYYEAYKTQRLQLLQDPHGLKHQSMYSESVATTFSITFRRIHENEYGPQAMNLLHLMAFLAADDIPQQMLTDYAQYHPGLLSNDSQTLSDYLALIRSKSLLSRYSLVKLDEVNGTVSLHRLVQQVVQDMMPGEEKASWARTAVGIINSQMPGQAGDALNWIPATGRLLAHGVGFSTKWGCTGLGSVPMSWDWKLSKRLLM